MNNLDKLEKNFTFKKIDSETINIQISNNNLLMAIVGSFNEHLLSLEKLTKTTIFFRGNSLTIKGQKENTLLVLNAIKFLIDKFILTNVIEKNDIVVSVKKNMDINKQSNVQSLGQLIKTPRKSVIARSEKQSEYIQSLKTNDIVMALGPAGTGKVFWQFQLQ